MCLSSSKGQLAGWEAVIIMVLIVYAGFITYKWASKPSEANVYQAESKPHIEDVKVAPFSCVRMDLERKWVDAVNKTGK